MEDYIKRNGPLLFIAAGILVVVALIVFGNRAPEEVFIDLPSCVGPTC